MRRRIASYAATPTEMKMVATTARPARRSARAVLWVLSGLPGHIIAITGGRIDPQTRAYLARKEAEGKSRIEAARCLKRHLARLPPAAASSDCNEPSRSTADLWLTARDTQARLR
jgi:hypothetical protein